MRLPKPFTFDGPGLKIDVVEVPTICSIKDDKCISLEILDPNAREVWFLVNLSGELGRQVVVHGKKKLRMERWRRGIITDGIRFYNTIPSRSNGHKIASRCRTVANKLGKTNQREISMCIQQFVDEFIAQT